VTAFGAKLKTRIVVVVIALIASATVSVLARQQSNHFFLFDGERVYVSNVVNRNGRLYYPVRELVEHIDHGGARAAAHWNEQAQMVSIVWGGLVINMTVGSPMVIVDAREPGTLMSASPFIHTDNHVYVPIRYVFENFGWRVTFNQSLRVPEICTVGLGVNIQAMIGIRLDSVWPFGSPTEHLGSAMHETYRYDTGAIVSVDSSGNIAAIRINYEQITDGHNFNFAGIDGTFTYNDVIFKFGNEPDNIRSGPDEENVGARISYGYLIDDVPFVRFFFDNNDNVIAIETHNNVTGVRR